MAGRQAQLAEWKVLNRAADRILQRKHVVSPNMLAMQKGSTAKNCRSRLKSLAPCLTKTPRWRRTSKPIMRSRKSVGSSTKKLTPCKENCKVCGTRFTFWKISCWAKRKRSKLSKCASKNSRRRWISRCKAFWKKRWQKWTNKKSVAERFEKRCKSWSLNYETSLWRVSESRRTIGICSRKTISCASNMRSSTGWSPT